VSRRALILATGSHSDPRLFSLSAPSIDAERLREVPGDPDRGGFVVADHVDRPCQDLKREAERFFGSASREELLFLYISGHAVKDVDRELHFAATDTQMDLLLSRAVEASFIQKVSESQPSAA
jgi:hypothetical protein